jgi:A/G-specific adenine glycosylase
VYEPPRRQGRFEGSLREARGAVIRHLVSQSSATVEEIAERSGLPADRISGAVDSLRADRMITATGSDAITLPDGGSA